MDEKARQTLWHTLQSLSQAPRYNRWIAGHFQPYIGQRVLEVGCGIGNLTPYFLHAQLLVALDVLEDAVRSVQARWGHLEHVRVIHGDITHRKIVEHLRTLNIDTVVFINVLEHIEEEQKALMHAREILTPTGHLLLYVPAHPWLYNTLDQSLGHQRRYTRQHLQHILNQTGFTPIFIHDVNLLGAWGWWFDGKIRQYPAIPNWQIRLFDKLVPFLRPAERLVRRVWPHMPGLSLVCVATPATHATHPSPHRGAEGNKGRSAHA